MKDPQGYFDPLQRQVFKWTLVSLVVILSGALTALLILAIVGNIDVLRGELAPHLTAILGLAGIGIAALLLVVLFKHQGGPMEVEALTIKFTGGAAPVVLWIMAFLAMVAGFRWLCRSQTDRLFAGAFP